LHLELFTIELLIAETGETEILECAFVVPNNSDKAREKLTQSVKKAIEKRANKRVYKLKGYFSNRVSLENELFQ